MRLEVPVVVATQLAVLRLGLPVDVAGVHVAPGLPLEPLHHADVDALPLLLRHPAPPRLPEPDVEHLAQEAIGVAPLPLPRAELDEVVCRLLPLLRLSPVVLNVVLLRKLKQL